MLANPSTGERVYDVLRLTDETKPADSGPSIRAVQRSPANGQNLALNVTWSPGKPARLYLPNRATFNLSWQERPNYRMAGYVEKKHLVFLLDDTYVDMMFDKNVLTSSERGPVWVQKEVNSVGGVSAQLSDLEVVNAKH